MNRYRLARACSTFMVKTMARKTTLLLLMTLLGLVWAGVLPAQVCAGEKGQPPGNPKMTFLGKFDAGVPDAGIYKMYDPSDDVVCYMLMPDLPLTKNLPQGVVYEGNAMGSISCVKVKVHVVLLKERK